MTFGDRNNFCTEDIVFDIADTPLPYNGILGSPALAMVMAASHYAYNVLKMPSEWGFINIKADWKDATFCVEQKNKTVVVTSREDEDVLMDEADKHPGNCSYPGDLSIAHPKKKLLREDVSLTKKVPLSHDGSHPVTIGTGLPDK